MVFNGDQHVPNVYRCNLSGRVVFFVLSRKLEYRLNNHDRRIDNLMGAQPILTDEYLESGPAFISWNINKFVINLNDLSMNNSQRWINSGYDLFAREGPDGIQVERLARILGLNKSGFYHYFRDRSIYIERLLQHHYTQVTSMGNETETIHSFDPEYLEIMIHHQGTVMVNRQLQWNRHIGLFENVLLRVNEKIDQAIMPVWAKYIGIIDQPELARRYFTLIRDVIYARITFESFNEGFLRSIVLEAKTIIDDTVQRKHLSLYSGEVKSQFFSFLAETSERGN